MRFKAKILPVVAGLLMLLAPAGSVRGADAPYEINVIVSLTGPGTNSGVAVQSSLKALEETTNERGGLNGRPIHFTIFDDQTNPQVAIQLANAIIAKNVAVFLGPNFASTCNAVAALVRNGPVDFCLSPSIYPEKNSFVFSAGQSNEDITLVAVRYFRGRG